MSVLHIHICHNKILVRDISKRKIEFQRCEDNIYNYFMIFYNLKFLWVGSIYHNFGEQNIFFMNAELLIRSKYYELKTSKNPEKKVQTFWMGLLLWTKRGYSMLTDTLTNNPKSESIVFFFISQKFLTKKLIRKIFASVLCSNVNRTFTGFSFTSTYFGKLLDATLA